MPRIPTDELERLKQEISLERVVPPRAKNARRPRGGLRVRAASPRCVVPAQRVGLRALAVAALLARPRSAATLPPSRKNNSEQLKK